jgi:hypothetical protein
VTSPAEHCAFTTTRPKGALSQPARGGATRYQQCRNRATHTITITEASGRWMREREVPCCGLHKRLHEERGWMP